MMETVLGILLVIFGIPFALMAGIALPLIGIAWLLDKLSD